jgi:hypothetical protein
LPAQSLASQQLYTPTEKECQSKNCEIPAFYDRLPWKISSNIASCLLRKFIFFIDNAVRDIEKNPSCGIVVSKNLIPVITPLAERYQFR